jgi:hypothetical protein
MVPVPEIEPAVSSLNLKYHTHPTELLRSSIYVGPPPSPETDAAWARLLETIDIRVTGKELARNNRSSVGLPRGGHLAWLGVYHELHCVVSRFHPTPSYLVAKE